MKQLFGEYLVKKELITQDQLLDALVEQTSSTPSLLEVCYKQNLFDASQILSILQCQSEFNLEFSLAGKKLNLWNEEKSDAANKYISSQRTPLGEILVSKGHLNNEQLLDTLDDYLHDSDADSTQPDPTPQKPPAETPPDNLEKGTPEPLETSEDHTPDPTPYCTYFHQDLFIQLTQQITETPSSIDDVLLQIHALRGLSQFVKLTLTQNLLKKLEDQVVHLKRSNLGGTTPEASACLDLLNCIWDLREHLQKGTSEHDYARQPEHQVHLQKF